ncbi:MAG: beta-propeller domain-containing protein [Candidatus Accumulibacter sp.]|nr:beta-propeller domain-containing protein [Accumulibacter sp.]
MNRLFLALFFAFAVSVFPAFAGENSLSSTKALVAFSSERELKDWLNEQKKRLERQRRAAMAGRSLAQVAPSPDILEDKITEKVDSEAVKPAQAESVTNTQTAGVDEGGIVKLHGDFLIVLRRGRLFTIEVRGSELKPVSVLDAFAPGTTRGGWYDELMVSGNTIVVIGYSYAKGGTEIIRFAIDGKGRLSYRSTHILRSYDYYSSRNYASRLIGHRLIFYAPLFLDFYRDPLDSFPAMRPWHPGGETPEFKRIAPATRIFRVDDDRFDEMRFATLHTVQVCDLSKDEMTCEATAVLGPAGREFYVSKDAVYVWTAPLSQISHSPRADRPVAHSAVFRLPLDGSGNPTALKTLGSPIDQFSFFESGDAHLNVLLRSEGPVASMWASEVGSGNLAFLRVPLSLFGDGAGSALPEHYHLLPSVVGPGAIQNRYVGDHLVYGAGNTWHRRVLAPGAAYALNWKNPGISPVRLPLAHTVDRIEALGESPLLVGTRGGDLHFTSYFISSVDGAIDTGIAGHFVLPGAAQGETRSHGFFYKPDGKDSGLLGLPFTGSGAQGWQQLRKVSTGVLFLRNDKLQLGEVGILGASSASHRDDRCKASCVDWYGNSRPLFLKGRIFALMGYEIVEGELKPSGAERRSSLSEIRRVDFAPRFSETRHGGFFAPTPPD